MKEAKDIYDRSIIVDGDSDEVFSSGYIQIGDELVTLKSVETKEVPVKDKIVGWIETVYRDHGPAWALATVAVLMGIIILFMYLNVNPLAWLN